MKVFLLAVLVMMTAVFAACSSDDAVTDTTENERGVVKTEFTISFPQKVSGATRVSQATVQGQATPIFRGIDKIVLYPFTSDSASVALTTSVPSAITLHGTSGATSFTGTGASGSSNNVIASNALWATNNSHLYQYVDIPIGTNSFLFYGEASAGDKEPKEVGTLSNTISSTATQLAAIHFSPVQIYAAGTVSAGGTAVENYLNSIAQTKATVGETTMTWAETTVNGNVGLATLYENFITMKAGSWNHVKAAVREMYKNLKENTEDNAMTKALKTAIRTNIASETYGVSVTGDDTNGWTWTFDNNKEPEKSSYPRDLNLPDGAAYVNWQAVGEVNKFVELADNGSNTGLNIAGLNRYVHPASLYYRVLSNIKTSNGSKSTLYNGTNSWETILADYENDNATVTSNTRSIAIKRQVQYAVGRLDVTVKANGDNLTDNSVNNTFAVTGTSFPVKGIVVSNQRRVDYKFTPDTTDVYTIYDQTVEGTPYLKSSASSVFHSLALPTKIAVGDEDNDAIVKVAVEFENNSDKAIVGKDGKQIPVGGRFYLIATLNPASNTTQHIDGIASNDLIKQVFLSDHTTYVNLTVKNLTNAYNTLPDLTVPRLEMGVSVDLTWKDGITFNVDVE